MTLVTFGQYLAIKREQQNLTQSEVARRCGVALPSYNRWEADQGIPSQKCMQKLTDYFKFSDEELEPYRRQDSVLKSKPKDMPISNLIAKAERAMAFVEEHMLGESVFERGVKNKAMDILVETIDKLKTVLIIDEAF